MVNTFSALPKLITGKANFLLTALTTLALAGHCSTAQAQNFATSYETADGIDDLTGIDPSADICTTGRPETDANKIFCFYNLGTRKFLSIGGLWGTHASISNTPNAIWFETTGGNAGQYYLNNKVDGSGTGTYLGTKNSNNLWMDQGLGGTAKGVFAFEKADGYSDSNKTYKIKTTNSDNTTYFVTTFPDNSNLLCNMTTTSYAKDDANYNNQVWKIISKAEYYELAKANPATMKAVIDFSFLMNDPDFRVNNTDSKYWNLWTEEGSTANLFFGDNTMYCTFENRYNTNTGHFGETYIGVHQQDFGKYFYCYAKGSRNFMMYQDVKVHKAGWYLLRCNGFSTQQDISGESTPLAMLFMKQTDNDGNDYKRVGASATLNVLNADEAKTLTASNSGAGAGVAFFNGEYENQVQINITTAADGNPVSNDNPAILRLGFYVAPGTTAISADDEITCVDNFKLLYAGEQTSQELILDEDNDNLLYLSKPQKDYTNTVLHLKRTLNDNQWNSLILPVSLTYGQMKRTFGDAVKVAKLAALTGNSIQFVTVNPNSDDEVMLKAFEPYIIYPPVVDVMAQAYTVKKFYYNNSDDNSEWLNSACTGPSTDDSDAFTLTVPQNHYDITMVTLKHDDFTSHVDTLTWKSDISFTGEGQLGKMVCYGTMAKTFDDNGIIPGRDDLAGDYFFYKGSILQVPADKQWGLKGFRCWFELNNGNSPSGQGAALYIDGVYESGVTGIDDIHASEDTTTRTHGIDGVFDLYGQRVRNGNSTEGLPRGIYITNGRKVVVK